MSRSAKNVPSESLMRKRSRSAGLTRSSNEASRCQPISRSSGSSTPNSCANFRRYGTAQTAMTSSRSMPSFIARRSRRAPHQRSPPGADLRFERGLPSAWRQLCGDAPRRWPSGGGQIPRGHGASRLWSRLWTRSDPGGVLAVGEAGDEGWQERQHRKGDRRDCLPHVVEEHREQATDCRSSVGSLSRAKTGENDRVERPVRADRRQQRARPETEQRERDAACEDDRDRAGDAEREERAAQVRLHDGREHRDAVPESEREGGPGDRPARAARGTECTQERAAERELLGEDDTEREIEDDVPGELGVADGRERHVRNGAAEERRGHKKEEPDG